MSDALMNHAIEKLRGARLSPSAPCKICGGKASPFDVVDFSKSCSKDQYVLGFAGIPVIYRMCTECNFIFTDFGDSFTGQEWQTYVYNKDYITVDPEYLRVRPCRNARELSTLLAGRQKTVVGLDYGGGNGNTAALLRTNDWTFDSYDPYGVTELSPERLGHYNFCSAIEVFEHLTDPVASLQIMLSMASPDKLLILIGTGTHDHHVSEKTRLSWWYAAPRNGHISLYSRKSLQVLAERFGLVYSCGRGGTSHLLARGFDHSSLRALLLRGRLLRKVRSTLGTWRGSLSES
ncbi:class I SAM-dependent methyltransferase [Terriglobus sp.]|uniref:class I SAM-dependent methyltransferase n=1 Tax=Terriglobus sp. TaxID=1889013 RepID=UPI003B00C054